MDNLYVKVNAPTPESSEHERSLYEKWSNDPAAVKADGCIFVPESLTGFFSVTSLSRNDFAFRGWDASKADDSEMSAAAELIAVAACDSGLYWDVIDQCAQDLGLAKIERRAE